MWKTLHQSQIRRWVLSVIYAYDQVELQCRNGSGTILRHKASAVLGTKNYPIGSLEYLNAPAFRVAK